MQAFRDRLRLKCDGTRAETGFRLSAKLTSPFKSTGASVQSTTGSRGVRISCSNAGYTMFRGSVKSTGYPLHSQVSPSLTFPCVTVCHHISTGLYRLLFRQTGSRQAVQPTKMSTKGAADIPSFRLSIPASYTFCWLRHTNLKNKTGIEPGPTGLRGLARSSRMAICSWLGTSVGYN
jgi:hypothetical protein